ncbi:MAG TPA: glycosyltransferase family 39 protein [Thermotogota bacterium]|nr:glycosyltransferase family 39 protein [Thermotogota bacterium]
MECVTESKRSGPGRLYVVFWGITLFLVLGLQFFLIQRPFRGHFASYQGVMAEIGRNMIREDFSEPLLPKTDLLIVLPTRSLHLNQYPLPSLLAALGVRWIGGGFEFWGRFQAIVFNLLSLLLMGGIATQWWGKRTGFFAAWLYLTAPFSIVYGQMFMSESIALFFLLSSFYLIERMAKDGAGPLKIVLAGLCFSVSALNRVHFVFLFPAFLYWAFKEGRKHKIGYAFLFCALSGLLPLLWYGFTYCFGKGPEMLRVHTSLFFQMGAPGLTRFGDVFSMEYGKYLARIILFFMMTPVVWPFFVVGIRRIAGERRFSVLYSLLAMTCLFLAFAMPQKILEQGFYFYGFFPFFVFVVAKGLDDVMDQQWFRKFRGPILLLYALCVLRFSIPPLFFYPPEEKNILVPTAQARAVSNPDDIFIVGGQGASAASYYLDRKMYGLQPQTSRSLATYYRKRPYDERSKDAIRSYETAAQDDITYVEYLRGKGASYVLILDKPSSDFNDRLIPYLCSRYRELSAEVDSFYLFKI